MFSRSVEGKVRSPLTARANATEQNARFAWRRQARAVEDGEDGSDTGVRTHLIANPRWHGYDQRAARSDPDELYFPKIAAAYGVLGQHTISGRFGGVIGSFGSVSFWLSGKDLTRMGFVSG